MEKVCTRTFLCFFLSCLFKLAWLLIHSQQECFTAKLLPAFQWVYRCAFKLVIHNANGVVYTCNSRYIICLIPLLSINVWQRWLLQFQITFSAPFTCTVTWDILASLLLAEIYHCIVYQEEKRTGSNFLQHKYDNWTNMTIKVVKYWHEVKTN